MNKIKDRFTDSQGKLSWVKIFIPLFTIITLPLIGLLYNNMAIAIDKKADYEVISVQINKINEELKQKSNNNTIKQMLLLQQQQQQHLQEQLKEQKDTNKEVIKKLNELNININLLEHEIKSKDP